MGNENDTKNWTLLDLPVYTLRILFSFLDATTLYYLSQTCTYLRDFIEDPLFWKYIDARKLPNTTSKLLYCTDKINEKTTHIYFGAKLGYGRIPQYFFHKIKPFGNLRILSLEFQKLNGFGVTLKDFPSCLEELSLKGTILKMRDSVSFFQHSSSNMTKLRVLILDNCTWLTCSFLISVAKYENLEIISVVNCPRIHLHTVPYLNVAKYGLKKLKVFDCRFTGIGAELLHTFYSKQSIQKFYFQSFSCAEIDYGMHFPGNSKMPLTSESYVDLRISDINLSQYIGITMSADNVEKICDSLLYRDPYPGCTCGHTDYHEDEPILGQIPEDNIPIPHVTKFICEKHLKEMQNLPDTFRDFCLSSQRDMSQDFEVLDDEDSSDDDFSCCTIGTTSKMVILQNVNDPSRRQEIVIPGTSSKFSGRQMNIFIVNPLGERENALLQNLANENIANIHVDRPNVTNENRETNNIRHAGHDEHRMQINEEHVNLAQENENNENTLNEFHQNQIRVSADLPSTSRGSQQNCINENTENSKIEHGRLKSETAKVNLLDGGGIINNLSQNSEDCDIKNENKLVNKDARNAVKTDGFKINANIFPRNSSTSKEYVIKTPVSINKPSCSGLNRGNESSSLNDRDTKDNSPIHNNKRKKQNDNYESSDSENDEQERERLNENVSSSSVCIEQRAIPTTSRNVVIVSDHQTEHNRKNKESKQSASHSHKRQKCSFLPTFKIIRGGMQLSNNHSDRDNVIEPTNAATHQNFRPELNPPVENSRPQEPVEGHPVRRIPEVQGDLDRNAFHLLRFNRPVNNDEVGRRINIRHFFPWPAHSHLVPAAPRLRSRFPVNDHKISLRNLSLRGYRRITDATLYFIKHLNLELLDLTYTSVTKEGIENFLLDNPSCRIVHQNYCRCKPTNPFSL